MEWNLNSCIKLLLLTLSVVSAFHSCVWCLCSIPAGASQDPDRPLSEEPSADTRRTQEKVSSFLTVPLPPTPPTTLPPSPSPPTTLPPSPSPPTTLPLSLCLRFDEAVEELNKVHRQSSDSKRKAENTGENWVKWW